MKKLNKEKEKDSERKGETKNEQKCQHEIKKDPIYCNTHCLYFVNPQLTLHPVYPSHWTWQIKYITL